MFSKATLFNLALGCEIWVGFSGSGGSMTKRGPKHFLFGGWGGQNDDF